MSMYPRRAEQSKEVTIRARIVFEDNLAEYLYLSVAKFRAGVINALEYAKRDTIKAVELYRIAYSVIGNKRYADGAVLFVNEIMESVKTLGVRLDKVKLRDWWMLQSRGSPRPEDRGNRNIRLVSASEAKVMLFNSISWSRYSVAIRVPRIYEEVFEDVAKLGTNCRLGYLARIVTLDMSYDRVYSELQLVIPYELYLRHRRRFEKPLGTHIAGIDVNTDRVNIVIVDRIGILRDVKTFHYPSLASPTLRGEQRRSLIHRVIHQVLSYAYHHGVSTIVLEDPGVLGRLKLRWIRNVDGRGSARYNRRVSIFKSSLIEEIALHAPVYGLEAYYVDPAYTSKLAEAVATEMGLDKHSASAYIVALEYLGLRLRQVVRSIQKSLEVA